MSNGNPIPSFDEQLLIKLCEDASKIFQKEDNIIELNGDVIIVGDIHGSFHDLLRNLNFSQKDSVSQRYFFLGDYVDKGSFSLECITLLFTLKILEPNRIMNLTHLQIYTVFKKKSWIVIIRKKTEQVIMKREIKQEKIDL